MRESVTAKKPITERLESIQRQLEVATHTSLLAGLVNNGHELRTSWDSLNLGRQHAVVRPRVDHAVIGPGKPGAQRLDPGRVRVQWRH